MYAIYNLNVQTNFVIAYIITEAGSTVKCKHDEGTRDFDSTVLLTWENFTLVDN